MIPNIRFVWLVALALLTPALDARAQAPVNGCLVCHGGLPDRRLSVPAADFALADVHRESGFGCVDCHGGDAAADSKERGHDTKRGFKGRPTGQAVITTCARCHSDAELMRRFSPRQRVDQATEYATSVHGKQLAAGDQNVATCASCHGAHGIRTVRDVKSPVYPTNVAGTCAVCHASDAHMRGYKLPDGSPLPTNQYAEYQKSVHYSTMVKKDDLSAPTCNDCHGNHGAAPPGVGAVVNVCGTCHAVFAQKFDASVHHELFDKGCVECHGNHAVLAPSDAMLGTDQGGVCGSCHSGADDKGAQAASHLRAGIDGLKLRLDRSSAVVATVRNAGMDVSGQELALAEARTRLTLARTEIHSAKPELVDPVLAAGLTLVDDVDAANQRSQAELRFRRTGLAISLVAILLLVVGLALKVRQIERRQASR
jgi:predicted CXXCH cytochrome family protein